MVNNRRKFLAGAIAATVAFGVIIAVMVVGRHGGDSTTGKDDGVIKIGVILPLTGGASAIGNEMQRGVIIAVEGYKNSGYSVQLICEDSANDPKTAVNAFHKLNEIDKADAIIVALTPPSKAVADSVRDKQTTENNILATFVSQPEYTSGSSWIFRMDTNPKQETDYMVSFAIKQLHFKNAALFYMSNESGQVLRDNLRISLNKFGGGLVIEERYSKDQSDYKKSLLMLKNKNPDCCFFAGNDESMALAMRQAREIGLDCPFFAPSSFSSPLFWNLLPDEYGDIYFVASAFGFSSENKSQKRLDFDAEYEKRFGGEKPTHLAGFPHALIDILMIASKKKEPLPRKDAINQSLQNIPIFDTVAGELVFDESRNISMPISLLKLVNKVPVEINF